MNCVIYFLYWKQNRKDAHEAKQQQEQKPSAVESESKSDSSSENEENASSASEDVPKIHVEFTEAEIIAPETNTVYKVRYATFNIFTAIKLLPNKKIYPSRYSASIVEWQATARSQD